MKHGVMIAMIDSLNKNDPQSLAEPIPFSLRLPRIEDVSIYYQYLQNPNVTIWLEDVCQQPLSYQQVKNFIMSPAWYRRAIEYNGAFIGLTGLEEPDLTRKVARFFVVIGDPSIWGKGLGEHVLRTVANEGFATLGLRKIISNYMEPNIASRIIHERVGFKVEGQLRQDVWRDDHWVDQVLVSLLPEELINK